jgi:hypothetical protein
MAGFDMGPPGVESDVVEPTAGSASIVDAVLIGFSVDGVVLKTFRTFTNCVIQPIEIYTSVVFVLGRMGFHGCRWFRSVHYYLCRFEFL